MNRVYGKGETAHIINAMWRADNIGVIERWKSAVADWAQMNRTEPDAAAVNAWLPLWRPRPFYTVDELVPMWPALAIATGFTNKWPEVAKSARRLEFELDFYGLPHFEMEGRKYYIVERLHFWKNATQKDRQNAFG